MNCVQGSGKSVVKMSLLPSHIPARVSIDTENADFKIHVECQRMSEG